MSNTFKISVKVRDRGYHELSCPGYYVHNLGEFVKGSLDQIVWEDDDLRRMADLEYRVYRFFRSGVAYNE